MKNDYEQGTNQLRQYLDSVPDELIQTANRYLDELENEMELHRVQCNKDYESCKDIATRDLANYFKDNPTNYQGCIYNIRNGRDIDKIIIRMVEPHETETMNDFLGETCNN